MDHPGRRDRGGSLLDLPVTPCRVKHGAMIITLADLTATERFAATVAAVSRPGDAILLSGDLGSGKTAFARGFLRAASEDPRLEVPSPSFTLVQSYATRRGTVHHFDLWRLDGPAALAELGWDDARDDIVLVEWPDRLVALTPPDALRLGFNLGEGDARVVTVSGWSGRLVLADP
jgi:tRNA threonylcarbamoyladenosine biosynthesis protein TsaE